MKKTIPLIDRCLNALAIELPEEVYNRAIPIIKEELNVKDALIEELIETLEVVDSYMMLDERTTRSKTLIKETLAHAKEK